MKNTVKKIAYILIPFSVIALSACSSMKIGDIVNLPEFGEAAENIGDYPEPGSAPQVPSDLRDAETWDDAAKKILTKRDGFSVPVDEGGQLTDKQVAKEIKTLKAKVKEYKLDDPVK